MKISYIESVHGMT